MDIVPIPDELKKAVYRYIAGKATLAEKKAVNDWFDATIPAEVEMAVPVGYDPEAERKRAILKLLTEINDDKTYEEHPVIPIQRRSTWKTPLKVAAVVAFFGMGAALLYYIKNEHTQGSITQVKSASHHIIVPGKQQATLTLSDGRVIALDSNSQGEIAADGLSRVTVQPGGLLQYETNLSMGKTGELAIRMNTITIPKGGEYQLVLPDGTHVWLNAASSLRYPNFFNGDAREVELTGEAYFQVTQNARSPFHVKANNLDVEVLGTEFNINAYGTASQTTLLNGKVLVRSNQKEEATHLQPFKILLPGQQAIQQKDGRIFIKNNVDVAKVTAWKEGYFLFSESTLDDVLQQISRWYDVDIVYQDGVIPPMKLEGKYTRSGTFEEALAFLRFFDVRYRLNGKQLIIQH